MQGKKTGGRVRGVPNKFTASAKEAFAKAFTKIGGDAQLAKWAQENPTEFYKLFARLIPVENTHSGPNGGPMTFQWQEPTS